MGFTFVFGQDFWKILPQETHGKIFLPYGNTQCNPSFE